MQRTQESSFKRIARISTSAIGAADTRVYLYDLDPRIVGEYRAKGTADIKAEYIWLMPEVGATGPNGGDDGLGGYMPLATAVGQAGTLNWLHTHHHGAPILTTNATGTVVPYPAHAVLGFPGQFANSQQLAGAQHYYNRYRDYDVNTGRYIQADPIGLAGDDNPYLYASGNPLKYGDPLGLNPLALRNAVVAGEALGGGLTIWCRANISLCMGTIGTVAIGVAKTCDNILLMAKGGKKNIDNEIVREVQKIRPPDICAYLRDLYQNERNPAKKLKIRQAQKRFNCDGKGRFQ